MQRTKQLSLALPCFSPAAAHGSGDVVSSHDTALVADKNLEASKIE